MALKTLALAACGAAALTACASGGGGFTGEPVRALLSGDAMMFVSFDADGDLSTTSAEIEAGIAREFARADSGGDGALTPIEFQSWANGVLGGGQLGPYRLDFDRNVDNIITRVEFETEIRGRVSDYDEDQSGALSRGEFVRLVNQARPPVERPRLGIEDRR
ncbi:EF-hand domain-containing protein [Terricaulis silvestris]|uniref:EF hand n=1 Tax=Terricaulis silvestris TaxID=2686094 RepID=A0A6I6MWU4_9CAUL|nr:hypothetical protein [Terricaulis silvestris]QGZ96102.1 EF hand [Terricaulis silvestris]